MKVNFKKIIILLGMCTLCFLNVVPVLAAQLGEVKLTGKRDFVWPVPSCHKISSCYKNMDYSVHANQGGHRALDIPGTLGSDVVAAYDGTVENSYWSNSFGNVVLLKHTNYQGKGITLYTQYNHMASRSVNKGASVKAGSKVGTVGATGSVDGAHLDFIVMMGGYSPWRNYSIDPFANQLLEMPNGFCSVGTSCCNTYVNEVKKLYATPPITVPTGTQTISDGEYHIVTKLGESYSLNISYNSKDSGANVQIANTDVEKDAYSIVQVTHIGNGYYKMTFKNSGKVLDLSGGNLTSGTNVQQYNDNGSDAQRWVIKEAGDGWYNIISKRSGMYLDVQGGVLQNYCNVQAWQGNGHDAQKWRFIASGLSTGKTIEDGEYHINTGMNVEFGLDIASASSADKANVHIWNNIVKDSQKWNVKYLGNGLYSIKNKNSGLALATASPWTYKGTNVYQYHETTGKDQKWIIKSAGNGFYNLVNEYGGMYLDVQGGGTATSGKNVQLYTGNGNNAQKWGFARQKEADNKIIFDLQGGSVEGAFASYKGNAANVGRGSGQLAVFTISDMKVTTNEYGIEAAVDSGGYVTAIRGYGSTNQLFVPGNGMVVSGHVNSDAINGSSFTSQLKVGDFVGYDGQTCEVKAYHDGNGYLLENKYVPTGSRYGTLPVPKKTGYIFDGWYTETDGGTRVDYNTTYKTSRLYAHWTEEDQASPVAVSIYNGRKYEVYDYSMSWKEAEAFCVKKGGHLVSITDAAENIFVRDLTKKGSKNSYHIGCTDEEKEGTWKWVTGEGFGYNNWDPHLPEPDGGSGQNYGAMITIDNPPNKEAGEWIDSVDFHNANNYYSGRNMGFVCEYSDSENTDNIRATVKETYDSHIYELYDCSMSWKDARSFCEKQGGHLVTVKDKAENDFLTTLLKKGEKNYYHIGCTDEEKEGIWKWVTGEDFRYSNWDPQAPEPNGGTNENYGEMISIECAPNKQPGEWMDGCNYYDSNGYYSSGNAGFVCEYERVQKDISGCVVELEPAEYIYDGNAKNPKVTIKDGNKELATDADYTVSYSNNINAGTATVTVTGTGNYTGSISKTYTITKAAQSMTASIANTSVKIGEKSQITATGIGTITYLSNDTSVVTVDSTGQITAVGEGEATITVEASGDSNYKAASRVITIYVSKKDCTHTWDAGKVTQAATCTNNGIKTYTCSNCRETKTEELPATGHQHTELRNVKEATYEQEGYTGDTYCKDCGTLLERGKTIPRLEQEVDGNAPVIQVGSVQGYAGEEVTVLVTIQKNSGIAGFSYDVNYDRDKLQLKKMTAGTVNQEGTFSVNENVANWYMTENTAENGTILKLTFAILPDTPDGNYPVSIALHEGKKNLVDAQGSYVKADYKAGKVEVVSGMTGDINGDKDITIADVVLLNRHVLGKTSLGADKLKCADINGDGDITIGDVVLLNRQVLGKNSLMTMRFYAEEGEKETKITVDDVTAKAGETFSIPVRIHNNPGIAGAALSVELPEGYSLESITKGEVLSEGTFTVNGKDCTWYTVDNIRVDGILMRLQVKAGENAGTGKVKVRVKDGKANNISDENGKTVEVTVTEGTVTIEEDPCAVNGHKGGRATCSRKAVCSVCGEPYGELDHTVHAEATDGRESATCTQEGYTGDIFCTDCGKTLKEGSIIEKLPHQKKIVGKKAATYFGDGHTGNVVCSKCNTVLTKGRTIKKLVLAVPGSFKAKSGKKLMTVTFKKAANSSGTQIQYAKKSNFSGGKVVTTNKTKVTVKKLTSKKTYYVRVRAYKKVGTKTVYSKWTTVKKAVVK